MQKIDYYSTDEEISWIASKVFSDKHYSSTLTEEELQQRIAIEEDYKEEIALAKLMLQNNPQFSELSFKDKINLSANLIMQLREKRTKNNGRCKNKKLRIDFKVVPLECNSNFWS